MLTNTFIESFQEQIVLIEDPRVARTRRHSLALLVFTATATFLTGGSSFYDMALFAEAHAEFLGLHFGMASPPSHDTFNRLFQMVKPEGFNAFLAAFAEALRLPPDPAEPDVLAFDGKTARRTGSAAGKALHTLNVWSSRNRLIIGQLAVEEKSNEITAMPELLAALDVRGCVVTADALNTQKAIAAQIVEQGGDYLLPLKGNHPLAEAEILAFMEPLADSRPPGFEASEKGHGRVETRRLWLSADIKWFADAAQWAGLRGFALLRCTREFPDGRCEHSQRLYLTSLAPDAQLIARAARSHWGVENSCHWCLDVTYGEDQSRARTRNAAQNLSALRKHTINLLRSSRPPSRNKRISLRGMRYLASQSLEYLISMLCTHKKLPKI